MVLLRGFYRLSTEGKLSDNYFQIFSEEYPQHLRELNLIARFLKNNQDLAPKPKKDDTFDSDSYWQGIGKKFTNGRKLRSPSEPKTAPDALVSIILEKYFRVPKSELEKLAKDHSLAMAAENIVGDILERYIASMLEPVGWVWCSGEVIKSVDFLAPSLTDANLLIPLQIKNRDTSENSSSSKVRDGTDIIKWFRSFSKTGETNWAAFPELPESLALSEESFRDFAIKHLKAVLEQNA